MIAIGIDTGGTCTDAVVYDFGTQKILASAKSETTHEKLEIGIGASIDKIPGRLLRQSSYLALSTTLATNACVENKGGRVKLIFLGAREKVVRKEYRSYGFESCDFISFHDGDLKRGQEPDWEKLEVELRRDLPFYDSVAIAQMHPEENHGAFEKKAAEMVRSMSDVPIVCAYELFQDRNVIQRGASAYLNAKLLPVIADFLRAVRKVLAERQLNLPILIMRSDGTMMSEEYAGKHPVETLLCGPAASVKGGNTVGQRQKAIVIDMGGTTTDIALIRGGLPVYAENGISIGSWRTFVKGLFIDTFGLGGDSEVCLEPFSCELSLSNRRVMALSVLASHHGEVREKLRRLLQDYEWGHTKPLYTFLLLQKDISEDPRYSSFERQVCRALQNGPLMLPELAEAVDADLYAMKLDRLEQEGILIRSGLTPTDMMCIKGDFTLYDKEAAELAVEFLARSMQKEAGELPDLVYELVVKKLYKNIFRIICGAYFRKKKSFAYGPETELWAEDFYERRCRQLQGQRPDPEELLQTSFVSPAAFVGVGAPIHVFLPRVAEIFGAECVIPEAAAVTNALGALIGQIRAEYTSEVQVRYREADSTEVTATEETADRNISDQDTLDRNTSDQDTSDRNTSNQDTLDRNASNQNVPEQNAEMKENSGDFLVFDDEGEKRFAEREEAVAYAKVYALQKAEEKAFARGAVKITERSVAEEVRNTVAYGGSLFLGSVVRAVVYGSPGK